MKKEQDSPQSFYKNHILSIKKTGQSWCVFLKKRQTYWVEASVEDTKLSTVQVESNHVVMQMLRHERNKQQLIFKATDCQKILIFSDAKKLKIKILPAWLAYFKIYLNVGSKQDNSYYKLAKLSLARYKRAGLKQFEKKLLEAYNPAVYYNSRQSNSYKNWLAINNITPPVINYRNVDIFPIPDDSSIKIVLCVNYKNECSWLETYASIKSQARGCKIWLNNVSDEKTIELNNKDKNILLSHDFCSEVFYIFFDSGDLLTKDSIKILKSTIRLSIDENNRSNKNPVRLIYFDHLKKVIDTDNLEPVFKTKFNYDHYLSKDYLNKAVMFRGELIISAQTRFKSSFTKINQNLRNIQAITSIAENRNIEDSILHIAWPLSIIIEDSIKSNDEYQELIALRKELVFAAEHLACAVNKQNESEFRVSYPFNHSAGDNQVTIIIPMKDKLLLSKKCVESVLNKTKISSYKIMIIDNNSVEYETKLWLSEIAKNPKIQIFEYKDEFNYSAINNFAVRHAKTPFICLLNNDTEIINDDWLVEMLQHASREKIGCVGAKLYYEDDTVQHGGVILGMFGLAGHSHKGYHETDSGYEGRLRTIQNYSAVTAACLVVKKEIFEKAGGLNEENLPVAFNDVDFCLKVKELGYENLWTPYATLYHYESKSRGAEDTAEKKARSEKEVKYMQEKWKDVISCDPYYNPNLTKQFEDFSIETEIAQLKIFIR